LVAAVEAANGVMVGVNREFASAGSAAWNFAVPKATVIGTAQLETVIRGRGFIPGGGRVLKQQHFATISCL
jgi:hypothetical protein